MKRAVLISTRTVRETRMRNLRKNITFLPVVRANNFISKREKLLMSGSEPRTCGVLHDRSVNCAATTTLGLNLTTNTFLN